MPNLYSRRWLRYASQIRSIHLVVLVSLLAILSFFTLPPQVNSAQHLDVIQLPTFFSPYMQITLTFPPPLTPTNAPQPSHTPSEMPTASATATLVETPTLTGPSVSYTELAPVIMSTSTPDVSATVVTEGTPITETSVSEVTLESPTQIDPTSAGAVGETAPPPAPDNTILWIAVGFGMVTLAILGLTAIVIVNQRTSKRQKASKRASRQAQVPRRPKEPMKRPNTPRPLLPRGQPIETVLHQARPIDRRLATKPPRDDDKR